MNKKVKIITGSVASMLIFGGLAVGGTYSLFSSNADTNIAVASGKVEVKASISDVKLYSGEWDAESASYKSVEVTDKFTNGGTASIVDGVVTLDKMSPMDKVTFNIKVENLSNIAIKYRTKVLCLEDDGLIEGLDASIDGEAFSGLTKVSNWATWSADEDLPVSIELPEDAGNDYQDKSTTIQFAVEAIQGNAHVEDPKEGSIYLDSPLDVIAFSKDVNATGGNSYNSDVYLMNDIDMKGKEMTSIGSLKGDIKPFTGIFDGQGYTISNAVINGRDDNGTGFFGSTSRYDTNTGKTTIIKNFNLDNAIINGEKNVGGIVGMAYKTSIENCSVTNSTITSVQKRAAGIVANMPASDPISSVKNCVSKNNVISACGTGTDGANDIITFIGAGTVVEDNEYSDNEFNYVAASASSLVSALADNSINSIKLTKGTFDFSDIHSTYGNDYGLTISRAVKIVGQGEETIFKFGANGTAISGQADLMIRSNNVSIEGIKVITTRNVSGVNAIKVTDTELSPSTILENITLKNIIVDGTAGHAINIHGTKDVVIDGCTFDNYGKCGLGVTASTNLTVTNSKFKVAACSGDIGVMKENIASPRPSTVTVGLGNEFGMGVIYSENASNTITIDESYGFTTSTSGEYVIYSK